MLVWIGTILLCHFLHHLVSTIPCQSWLIGNYFYKGIYCHLMLYNNYWMLYNNYWYIQNSKIKPCILKGDMNIPGLLLYTFFIINSYTYYKIDKKNTLSCELKNKYFIVKELKIMIFFQRLPLSQVKGFLEYIHTCSVMHLGSL